MSGHSKWSQIKHKKGATDEKRGQVFSKLVKEITIAAREGGVRPESNARLRSVMERAGSEGLPKDNMERALIRASGKGEGSELFEFLYEAAAPAGVAILIEGITDNKNRTLAEIRHLLGGYGARLAEQGSLAWNFEKIGTLVCHAPKSGDKTSEEIEIAIIESGASDFQRRDDGAYDIEAPAAEREHVREALERQGITVMESGHDYKPKTAITPESAARAALEPLLDALAEHDDMQEVYTNLRE